MAKKVSDDDDYENDGDMSEDFEEIEHKLSEAGRFTDARRRLEQLREEKELERLINSNEYDDLF